MSPRRRIVATLTAVACALAGTALLTAHRAPATAGPEAAGTTVRAAVASPLPKRPNIVVVMADDMRVDDLAFAPRIRKLLRRNGVEFENSFSPYPLCCPARASFLTGQLAHNHEVYWHNKPYGYGVFDDSRTIATALKARGYRTGFVGKYLNGYGVMRSKVSGRPSYRYVPRGWTDWAAAIQNPGGKGIHGGAYVYFDTPFNVDGRIDNRYRGKYQTNVMTDFAVRMVKRFHRARKPFLLSLNYVAPHHGAPHEADDPGRVRDRRGKARKFGTPARPNWVKGRYDDLVRRPAGVPRRGGPAERNVSDKPAFFRRLPRLNKAERRALTELTRQRAESILVMDRQVARLVRQLKRSGEWRKTVLMFTSDNGYFLGEHRQRTGKVKAHEPSLRVPLLMTGPGMRGGEKRYDPATTVDVTATILDLAGAKAPRRADGTSLLPTLLRGDRGWSAPVVTESTHGPRGHAKGFHDARTSIGVRTSRWSYHRHRNGAVELYDLVKDPRQLRSRHDDPDYAQVRRELYRLWREVKDCRGAGCKVTLPDSLAADADTNRSRTRRYWQVIDRYYGWR